MPTNHIIGVLLPFHSKYNAIERSIQKRKKEHLNYVINSAETINNRYKFFIITIRSRSARNYIFGIWKRMETLTNDIYIANDCDTSTWYNFFSFPTRKLFIEYLGRLIFSFAQIFNFLINTLCSQITVTIHSFRK